MADNPDIQWALELLKPYEETNFFYAQQPHFFFFGVGVGFACFANHLRRRPVFSGLPQHLFWGVTYSAIIGGFYKKYSLFKRAKEATITRDYIIKHPADFPEPKRTTWGDVFDPWVPVR